MLAALAGHPETVFAAAAKYKVEGIVVEVDRAQGIAVISHKPVPGYMPAMVMPFRAERPRELQDLQPGMAVTFDLIVDRGKSRARNIRVAGVERAVDPAEFQIPKPANALAVGAEVPDFELVDQNGRGVRLSQFRGRTVAIQFVYTRCPLPDVCPRLAAHFAFVHRKLGSRVQLLTITVDPGYDTPEVLQAYAARWRADGLHWRFLTGAEDRIQTTGGLFGVVFWPEEGAVTHTSSTAVIGADGRLKAILLGSDHRAEQLLDLIERQLR